MWKTGVVWLLCKASRCQGINLWRPFVILSSRRGLQTYRYCCKMSRSHSVQSHNLRNRLNVLLLNAAQKKGGKMSAPEWTFLEMLCTLSIAGLFPGSGHSSSPPCFLPLSIIRQFQYDTGLDLHMQSCASILWLNCVIPTARVGLTMQMFLICVLFKGRSYYHGQGSLWLQTPVIFFEMRGCQWNSEWPGFPEKITRQSNCKEFQIYCVRHFYLWVWPYHPDPLSQNLEE